MVSCSPTPWANPKKKNRLIPSSVFALSRFNFVPSSSLSCVPTTFFFSFYIFTQKNSAFLRFLKTSSFPPFYSLSLSILVQSLFSFSFPLCSLIVHFISNLIEKTNTHTLKYKLPYRDLHVVSS